nr:cyclin-dependent kinase inhibitor 1C-like [Aegilops tauschii subsp. strangulata]
MLMREFLMLRVAPLQARSRPLWTLGGEEDKLRLSPGALSDEELAVALRLLVRDNQEYSPSAIVPLFRRKDGAQVAAAMPTFDERGLVPPAPLVVPEATTPADMPAAKKRREEAVVLPGTNLPVAATSPSVETGSIGAHASLARSSSRGPGEHPREESAPVAPLAPAALVSGLATEVPKAHEPPASQAMVTIPPPPPPAAPLAPGPSASPDVLEHALSEMTRL